MSSPNSVPAAPSPANVPIAGAPASSVPAPGDAPASSVPAPGDAPAPASGGFFSGLTGLFSSKPVEKCVCPTCGNEHDKKVAPQTGAGRKSRKNRKNRKASRKNNRKNNRKD